MQPHERRGTASTTRARVGSRSYSTMYGGGATATLASTSQGDALATTLSVKDVQRCFEKERQAFLRDLESLRQQLVKKDQAASKAAAVASQQAIALKKEIASLQASLSASKKEAASHAQQFRHTSALLETALDQHQADQAKLAELGETLRTSERKHEDALAVVRKEAAASVASSHEERKALRARVDQLRAKLEAERKEFVALKTPLSDELARASVRLSVLEKEVGDARYRESASLQLKEKVQSDVLQYKRKVADLSTALQEALTGKSELKVAHQLVVTKMKDKWREVLAANAHAREQLVMLQEDYNGLFRSRSRTAEQNERVGQSLRSLQLRHEQQLEEKDRDFWDLEKRLKRTIATCTVCMKTPEQRHELLEAQLESAREATRREVVKEMELERWDRFQDVNAKYMDVAGQLQAAMRDGDQRQREWKTLAAQHDELLAKEKKLVEMLSRTERHVKDLERKASDDAQRSEDQKAQLQELMENLSKMTTVTADQSKQLQELELCRREELDRMKQTVHALTTEKQQLLHEKDDLQQQLDQQGDALEQLKAEKAKQWNEIMSAQLSANLLIEEQAHTIDTLLRKARYVSPSKSKVSGSTSCSGTSPPRRNEREPSSASGSSDSSSPLGCEGAAENESAGVVVLRHECERLREELTERTAAFGREKENLQCEYEQKVVDLMRELTALQRQSTSLKRRLDEQAVTIHELTLQDDEDEEEEDGDEEEEEEDPRGQQGRRRTSPRRNQQTHQTPRQQANEWTPQRRPSRAQPPAPTTRIRKPRASGDYGVTLSKDLSRTQPESDEDATVGVSFVSTSFS